MGQDMSSASSGSKCASVCPFSGSAENGVSASVGLSVVLDMTLRMEEGSEKQSSFSLGGRGVNEVLSSPSEDFSPPLAVVSTSFLLCSLALSQGQSLMVTPVG